MIILDKIFTREFPLFLNQLWGGSYDYFFDKKLELYPKQVFIMKDGMTIIYRNPKLYNKINEGHLEQIRKDTHYLDNFYNRALLEFTELEKMWLRDYLSKEELIHFYEMLTKHWAAVYSAVYIPKYPDLFSVKDRNKFINLRVKIDVVADKATEIITRSLVKLYGISSDQAYYISYNDLLDDNIDSDRLDKLIANDLYIIDGNILGKEKFDLEKAKNNFDLEKEIIGDNKNILGTIAQKGIVQGRVRLLMRRSEIDQVKEGEILVTYMTIPDYIPAMKRASAFVTDEGGITCHAAIIAREMKKPCIIGTKFATKILKDGDMVEVDADKGIVKKIDNK